MSHTPDGEHESIGEENPAEDEHKDVAGSETCSWCKHRHRATAQTESRSLGGAHPRCAVGILEASDLLHLAEATSIVRYFGEIYETSMQRC